MKDVKRNRRNENLAGLYVVDSKTAYKNNKLRKGVLGAVDKTTPFVFKPKDVKNNKPRKFVKDTTALPAVCKNRILAFFDKKENVKKRNCYLVEKSLYDEMQKNKESSICPNSIKTTKI